MTPADHGAAGADPLAAVAIVAVAGLYLAGGVALRRRGLKRPTRLQVVALVGAVAALALALVSPLATLADDLFSAHMVQHLLLLIVAAPLLVLARPVLPLLTALPPRLRRHATALGARLPHVRPSWEPPVWPAIAWLAAAGVVWVWHAPPLYEAALHDAALHAAEHVTLLVAGIAFWWMLSQRHGRLAYAGGVVYVFLAALQSGALGAFIAFAPSPWYATYETTAPALGIPAAQDQRLAGLIMWLPAGLVYTAVGLGLFAAWLRQAAREQVAAWPTMWR